MTTRVIAPATTFALGAYAEKHGYVGAALASARDVHPTFRSGIDAVFGADAFATSATTMMGGDSSSSAVHAAGGVVEKAMRAVREMFGGIRDVAAPTLGAAPTAMTRSIATTTTSKASSSMVGFGVPSAWTVFFAAGALTGCVVAYAVGPERCALEAKKALKKVKASAIRAKDACADVLSAVLVFEFPVAIKEAFMNVREFVSGASKQLAPLLKSSSDNLLSLIDASKGTTTAYAGKVTEFVGDFRVKYVDVAAIVVREKTIETYVAAKATTRKAYDKTKPVVSRAARVVREFVAHVIDSIKP
jgi:hypothetical protein